jgi:hypothetical protein
MYPIDIVREILSHLPCTQVILLARVSRLWKKASNMIIQHMDDDPILLKMVECYKTNIQNKELSDFACLYDIFAMINGEKKRYGCAYAQNWVSESTEITYDAKNGYITVAISNFSRRYTYKSGVPSSYPALKLLKQIRDSSITHHKEHHGANQGNPD